MISSRFPTEPKPYSCVKMAAFYQGPLPTAFALGIVVHNLLLKYIELDIYLPHFFILSIFTQCALTYSHFRFGNLSVIESILKVSAETVCFIVGVFLSMVIYRAFFHRIRHFPGPFWARVSRFYAFGLAAKNLQYHVELQKLHEEYGDFIRTGMFSVHLSCWNSNTSHCLHHCHLHLLLSIL
jgi:hypothetical protein